MFPNNRGRAAFFGTAMFFEQTKPEPFRSSRVAQQARGGADLTRLLEAGQGGFGALSQRKRSLQGVKEQLDAYRLWNYIAVTCIAFKASSIFPMIGRPVQAERGRQRLSTRDRRHLQQWYGGVLQSQDRDFEPVPETHPAIELFRNPNPADWWGSLAFETHVFWQLTGEFYWWLIPNAMGRPVQIVLIPNQWIQPKLDSNNRLAGWQVRPNGDRRQQFDLRIEDVLHGKFKGPLSKLHGFSPSMAGAEWIDAGEAIETSRIATFENAVEPSVRVKLPSGSNPKDEIIERTKQRFMDRAAGLRRRGEPLLVPPDWEVERHSTSPKELDFSDSSPEIRDNILALRGVNKVIAGISTEVNRAVHEAAVVSFCVDDQTECLTADGWKKHDEVDENTLMACYDPDHERIIYRNPTDIHKFHYSGEMIRWNGRGLDALMTPDHRCFVQTFEKPYQHQSGHRRDWNVRLAGDIQRRTCTYRIKQAAPAACSTPSPVRIDSVRKRNGVSERWIAPDVWLEFLGLFVSEGHTSRANYTIGITQSCDSPDIERIEECLSKTPFNWHRSRKNPSGCYQWTATDKALYDHLRRHCGTKSWNKTIPSYVKDWPADSLGILLDSALKGDGRYWEIRGKNGANAVYHTSSPQLADDIQEIAIKCGHSAARGVVAQNIDGGQYKGYQVTRHGTERYYVALHSNPVRTVRPLNRTTENYDGLVWCVTVPTGFWVVRRNGRAHITGNCENRINPILRMMAGFLEMAVRRFDSRLHLWFPDCTPENREALLKEMQFDWTAGALQPDEVRIQHDREPLETPESRSTYVPANVMPLSDGQLNPSDDLEDEDEDLDEDQRFADAERLVGTMGPRRNGQHAEVNP